MSTAISRVSVTDDDGSGQVGTILNAAFFTALFDAIDNNPSGWTSYSPTWSAITTPPSLGDGTLTGRYCKIGKMVFFEIELTMGASTTYGSGAWTFTSPTTNAKTISGGTVDGGAYPCRMYDTNLTDIWLGLFRHYTSTTITGNHNNEDEAATSAIQSTVPFTWASGDTLTISGFYIEA